MLSERLARALLLSLPLVSACSGGYPLPPTLCDDWCDATKGGQCAEYYDPAGCVATCEQSGTVTDQCQPLVDAVISCYRQHPEAVREQCYVYSSGTVGSCRAETDTLTLCVSGLYQPRDGA